MAQHIEVTREYNNVDGVQIRAGTYPLDHATVAPLLARLQELGIASVIGEPDIVVRSAEKPAPKPPVIEAEETTKKRK